MITELNNSNDYYCYILLFEASSSHPSASPFKPKRRYRRASEAIEAFFASKVHPITSIIYIRGGGKRWECISWTADGVVPCHLIPPPHNTELFVNSPVSEYEPKHCHNHNSCGQYSIRSSGYDSPRSNTAFSRAITVIQTQHSIFYDFPASIFCIIIEVFD